MPLPSAKLPELPKQERLFLTKSTSEFFMPTVQELQCYQVTSHRHQERFIRQMNQVFKERGGG